MTRPAPAKRPARAKPAAKTPSERARQQRRRDTLNRLIIAHGISVAELARLTGIPDSTLRSYLKGDTEDPSIETYEMLADGLEVPVDVVLGRGQAPAYATLVGGVGAGDTVDPLGDDATFEAIPAPPGMKRGAFCVVVRGDSMLPVYRPNDLLFYEPSRDLDSSLAVGHDCVLQLVPPEDGFTLGGMLIKKLYRDKRAGRFQLVSYNPAVDPMADQAVAWAAPVRWVQRA